MKVRSHANFQRELRARSRAAVIGCLAVVIVICAVGCGLFAACQTIGG